MKTKILTLLLLFGFTLSFNTYTQSQNLNKFVNKAKKNVKLKNNKSKSNTTKSTTTNNNSNTNQNNSDTKTTVNENNDNNGIEALVIDPATPVTIEYEQFFKKAKLEIGTGEFKLEEIKLNNLPKENFGPDARYHKLIGILKLKDKELQKFPFKGSGNGTGQWTKISQRNESYENSSYTFTEGGNYTFELQIDNKTVDKIDFSVVLATQEGNKGYFIDKPLNRFAFIGCSKVENKSEFINEQWVSVIKPAPNTEFVFNFYDAQFKIESGMNEYIQQFIRLMKVNPSGEDIFMGGNYEEEHNRPRYMKLNKYFFKDDNNQYVKYDDVIKNDGKYYIDLIIDTERFRYDFEVKNNTIISSEKNRTEAGTFVVKRDQKGFPKYEGYRPSASISGKAQNVSLSVKKEDGGSIGYGTNKPVTIYDGKVLMKNIYVPNELMPKYNNQLTEYITTLKLGNEIIAQHINVDVYTNGGSGSFVRIMHSTDKKGPIYQKYETGNFMEALAKLPAGTHKLTFVWEMASGEKSDVIGLRHFNFKSNGKNEKYTKWGKETNELLLLKRSEMTDLAFMTSASYDWCIYVNTCGRVIWLRQDESKEYIMGSGNKIKLDRSRGYIEQWNFGTRKWKSTNDFKTFKTIYKLGQNSYAMLYLKQKEWAGQLKPIVDKEFKTQEAYLAEVKKLIGAEKTKEFEDMIVESASIDYVKICQ